MKIDPPGAPPSKRRGWLALPAGIAILALLHTLYWQWLRRGLEDGLHDWTARRVAGGWRIGGGPPAVSGWPFTVALTLPDPVVTLPDRSGWSAAAVVLRVRLLRPDRLGADAPGAQKLVLPGGSVGFTANRLHLELPLAGGDAPAEFSLAASRIALAPAAASPVMSALGPRIGSLSVAGRISRLGPLTDTGATGQARRWRDRGGQVVVRHFTLLWGKLDLSGNAVLALDGGLQPEGDGTMRVAGFAEAVAALAGAGAIPPDAALLAMAAFSMLSDGSGSAEVPLHLQAGRVTVRQIPLFAVPELAWP